MKGLLASVLVLTAVAVACGEGNGDDATQPSPNTASPGKATIGSEDYGGVQTFDCDWLVGHWERAAREELGADPQTWDDYKPAALQVAFAMRTKVPEGQRSVYTTYIYADADRVLRQCNLPGYPPWKN